MSTKQGRETGRMKITVEDLWLTFEDPRRGDVPVLHGIDLAVRDGEFVCLVGPSGCGKSTLLNIVGGFLRASRGKVLFDGVPVDGPDSRRIFIFQENGVFPWLTVEANIGFGLSDRSPTERKAIVAHYTQMVGLTGFERSYPREISGGMRQRVELARALAADPDVLFMDEPFGALDYLTRLRIRADVVDIWQREKKTVLFVTHDVEEAVQLADRVVVLGQRPSTVRDIVPVDIPRPRNLDDPACHALRDEIFRVMGFDRSGKQVKGPDEPEPAHLRIAAGSVGR
jgi:NitT/TauT family transport system ATP-binding protein